MLLIDIIIFPSKRRMFYHKITGLSSVKSFPAPFVPFISAGQIRAAHSPIDARRAQTTTNYLTIQATESNRTLTRVSIPYTQRSTRAPIHTPQLHAARIRIRLTAVARISLLTGAHKARACSHL